VGSLVLVKGRAEKKRGFEELGAFEGFGEGDYEQVGKPGTIPFQKKVRGGKNGWGGKKKWGDGPIEKNTTKKEGKRWVDHPSLKSGKKISRKRYTLGNSERWPGKEDRKAGKSIHPP